MTCHIGVIRSQSLIFLVGTMLFLAGFSHVGAHVPGHADPALNAITTVEVKPARPCGAYPQDHGHPCDCQTALRLTAAPVVKTNSRKDLGSPIFARATQFLVLGPTKAASHWGVRAERRRLRWPADLIVTTGRYRL